VNRFILVPGLLVVAACNNNSGPSFPALAGTYATVFNTTFSNSDQTLSNNSGGTITLQSPQSSGAFTGTYIIPNGGGSGTVAGVERMDGGISITQFGPPGETPLEALAYLQQAFNWCDFTQASGVPTTGAVSGSSLQLSGGLIMPCYYTNGTTTFPLSTTLSLSIDGTRN
jgi:hypothetical protein